MNGTVQGVGFRPFIYRTAVELGLTGHVRNTPEGVSIEAQGPDDVLNRFIETIRNSHPPLARVQEIAVSHIPVADDRGFRIVLSESNAQVRTLISPDIAPCDDCLAELLNPSDRRHLYPFINCTNCGPRYTIVESLPYDRPKTTMKAFEMCDACAREYADPEDRRFHAQPDACGECGPRLKFRRSSLVASHSSNPLEETMSSLDRGEIAAIKCIGGFHLACDATNPDAVMELRRRKRRDEKPFAVMVSDLHAARKLCHISDIEAKLLESPQRPVVLLRKKDNSTVSDAVAPGNKNLGLMLPSSPLHHLLFFQSRVPDPGSRVFVMTSGNISDEPIAYTNEGAFEKLEGIADAYLIHDRDIHIRTDDSIARCIGGAPVIIRRARGYVPEPVRLAFDMPHILATGADLKGAICLTKDRSAFLSHHLGDLENAEAHRAFEQAVEHLQRLLDIQPVIIAHDLHPDYFSTRFARSFPGPGSRVPGPVIAVQHHHAHIASCMAENDFPNEKAIGIALDGMGYGTDGTIWGGEILIADYEGFERAAHFKSVPMPGGDAAAREPWRMALAYLRSSIPHSAFRIPHFTGIDGIRSEQVLEIMEKGVNCPLTSSCGRLFDAVAALIGLRAVNTFEGQAAMELEQIADEDEDGAYGFIIGASGTGPGKPPLTLPSPLRGEGKGEGERRTSEAFEIDFAPMIGAIAEEVRASASPAAISVRFHNTVVKALVEACVKIRTDSRFTIHDSRVCLSGGCFQNALLASRLKKRLEGEGFKVYTHSLVPPNDGGVALGQAVVAAHQ